MRKRLGGALTTAKETDKNFGKFFFDTILKEMQAEQSKKFPYNYDYQKLNQIQFYLPSPQRSQHSLTAHLGSRSPRTPRTPTVSFVDDKFPAHQKPTRPTSPHHSRSASAESNVSDVSSVFSQP